MPIMVRNIVKTKPETILKIKEKYCDDEYFNLEKIEKMPARLDFSEGSETVNAILYAIYLKSEEELRKLHQSMKEKNVDVDYLSEYVFKTRNEFCRDKTESY